MSCHNLALLAEFEAQADLVSNIGLRHLEVKPAEVTVVPFLGRC